MIINNKYMTCTLHKFRLGSLLKLNLECYSQTANSIQTPE